MTTMPMARSGSHTTLQIAQFVRLGSLARNPNTPDLSCCPTIQLRTRQGQRRKG